MAAIRINLFGRLAVFVDDRPLVVGSPHLKPIEIFTYLLIHRRRSHSREAIATLLWPDLPPAHAKKNLRKVLCTLQHLLADAVMPSGPPVLLIEHDWIALNPALDLQLDVEIFEHAYTLAQQQADGVLDHTTAQEIAAAVALYEGELLAGLYTDWCLRERERLEDLYLELRHLLLVDAERRCAYEQAIAHGRAILRHDRSNERTHRDLMRLYYVSGDRSAALHQYEHCAAALSSELGVRPGAYTQGLYQQICHDELMPPGAAPASEPAALRRQPDTSPESSQSQLIGADLQRTLGQAQGDLQRVERLLKQQEVGASRRS